VERARLGDMTEVGESLAATFGDRIRTARVAEGRRQRDVADMAGVSETMVCRMELGRGASISLGSWAAVAAALGVDLDAAVSGPESRRQDDIEVRCHTLAAEVARGGGWTATTEIVRTSQDHAPSSVETILFRPSRNEATVVRVWHPVLNINVALNALQARQEDLCGSLGLEWTVGALVLCVWTIADRRRISELAPRLATVLPATSAAWMAALRYARSPMPSDGLLWTHPSGLRFKPAGRHPGWQRSL
jgi:transcriptional regulator with XRE-family HTH domain